MDVIVIGGATGALDVLKRLVAALPSNFPAAVVVVLHPDERHPKSLAAALMKATPLDVSYADAGETLRRGHLYLAPPDHHLVFDAAGQLELDDGPKVRLQRPAADRLFKSAARVFGREVIGVLLSGSGNDGTDGLIAIKGAGGLSIVQSPSDAQEPGMPTSGLLNDSPDHVPLAEELGPLIQQLVEQRAQRTSRRTVAL
ncbi:chemotaxis protein CheB [Variovorax sp. UMC13]|uniref:chemotaxis protein CheB n=1 Tax=Variovorax sp. UMC13 TaxID=1862326 RepID=UPI001602FE67|nr:chemotaxis protein CheB [Variovorax sp. UMC13]